MSFLASIVNGGTRDPNVPDTKYINYGQDFHYVVKLCGKDKSDKRYCASAVVIGPNHIITAAHVVKDAVTYTIKLDNNKEYCIDTIICHKDFNESEFGLYDIALGYSKQTIELSFYPSLYTDRDECNKLCSIAGYGLYGTFISGANQSDDKRRAGSNIIDKIDRHLLICSPSRFKSDKKTSLEFIIASGDSGGGLFIDGKLAGINSCIIANGGKAPKADYNTECGHTRISEYIDWIKDNIE